MTILTASYPTASEINTAMAGVYKHMAMAVAASMLTAMAVASMPAMMSFLFTGWIKWIVIFAPLVAVFAISSALTTKISAARARFMLLTFAVLMGLSFSTIFVVYKLGSIVSAFMGGAILFGIMSLYGYFTKNSLDSVGRFMFVGLVAIIVASIVNIFIGSSVFAMVVSALAIIIFLGLTAYDTQKIREQIMNGQGINTEMVGALSLYLNFINIFLNLLQIFGARED